MYVNARKTIAITEETHEKLFGDKDNIYVNV